MVAIGKSSIGVQGALSDYIKNHPALTAVTMRQRILMIISLTNFIEAAVKKFGAGQKAHGGSILDRDLGKEMKQELIDSFWYQEAEFIWKPIENLICQKTTPHQRRKRLPSNIKKAAATTKTSKSSRSNTAMRMVLDSAKAAS